MKKTISMILLLVMAMLFCLTGCQKTVAYTTKYITNCEMAEFRQEASNAATILQYLDYGEAVSFEEDVANGYAKVVYQGVTGYVLSSMLTTFPMSTRSTAHDIFVPFGLTCGVANS